MSDTPINSPESSSERCPLKMENAHQFCSAGTCKICQFVYESRPLTDDEKKSAHKFFSEKFED